MSCGVGAARTVEDREKREIATNVEVFMMKAMKYATNERVLWGVSWEKRADWKGKGSWILGNSSELARLLKC